jgi:hypothetical protein
MARALATLHSHFALNASGAIDLSSMNRIMRAGSALGQADSASAPSMNCKLSCLMKLQACSAELASLMSATARSATLDTCLNR